MSNAIGFSSCLICEADVSLRVAVTLRAAERPRDFLVALRVIDESASSHILCEEMCDVCAPLVVRCDELFCALRDSVNALEIRRPGLSRVHQLEAARDFADVVADALEKPSLECVQEWNVETLASSDSGLFLNADTGRIFEALNVFGEDSNVSLDAIRVSNLDSSFNNGSCSEPVDTKFCSEFIPVLAGDAECRADSSTEMDLKPATAHTSEPTTLITQSEIQRSKKCEICSFVACRASSLNRHIARVHLNIKSFKCPTCEETFGDKRAFLAHDFQVHRKSPRFRCDVCGEGFYRSEPFNFHKRSHQPAETRLCHLCGKRLQFNSFNSHVQAHKKRNPRHECGECGKKYSRAGALGLHLKTAHGVKDSLLIPASEEKQCPKCSWTGKNKDYFVSHMFLTHGVKLPGLVELPCSICDRIFYGNKIFKKHVQTHARKEAGA